MENSRNLLDFARIQSFLTPRLSSLRGLRVGYSGGVDSHVLLHLLATHRQALYGNQLTAIHVNHGLQPAAIQWENHCSAICKELKIDFLALQVDARSHPGESPEAAARRARYRAFEALLEPGEALLIAHHRDDQAETLLLQLLRGAGPHGLAAMPQSAPLGRGLLLRPLLETDRQEIVKYAQKHRLDWIEDHSNVDQQLDRNYLRHLILPSLQQRWPAATRTLSRSARRCAETAMLLDELAETDLDRAATENPSCLDITPLRTLAAPRQRNALRHWFRRLNLPSPAAAHLRHILSDALAVSSDRTPHIHWPGGEVRRFRDRLYAMTPLTPHDTRRVFMLYLNVSGFYLPGMGQWQWRITEGTGLGYARLVKHTLTLRFRRGGERLRLPGGRPSRSLKKLFQDAGIPPWERERLPLLYVDDTLAAVADLWIAADFVARPAEKSLVLAWQKELPSVNL